MGYTEFYQDAKSNNAKITWRDILNESFKRHSHQELEYAISVGTIHDRASDDTMLQKWHKPWVWFRIFCILLAISLALYFMIQLLLRMGTNIPAIGWISVLFATLVTPVPFMILLWELNIPRNISLFSMIGYFVVGGILSLFFSGILFALGVAGDMPWWAPLAEEPGKLLAAVMLLCLAAKSRREVYGCTGLAIGAGVGAGFTVFETFGYAFGKLSDLAESLSLQLYSQGITATSSSVTFYVCDDALKLVFYRSIPCLAAHLIYCAPYTAALALIYHKTHSWKDSMKDKTFLILFGISVLLHALWNLSSSKLSGGIVLYWIIHCAIAAGSFYALFYAIRLCLAQAVNEGRYVSGSGSRINGQVHNLKGRAVSKGFALYCKTTALRGTIWKSSGSEMIIGRQKNKCTVCFPDGTSGVSRQHCRFYLTEEGWFVQDLNSTCGTYVAGRKLMPNESFPVRSGDNIYLGSQQVWLTVL